MRTARVFRLSMAHPGDLSELDNLIEAGTISASEVAAIIGKTEGNGGVNDFTRGYFTQTLMALLSRHLNRPASQLIHEIPCVLSGGTEGVMSPHYSLFCIGESEAPTRSANSSAKSLAIGTAFSSPVPPMSRASRQPSERPLTRRGSNTATMCISSRSSARA